MAFVTVECGTAVAGRVFPALLNLSSDEVDYLEPWSYFRVQSVRPLFAAGSSLARSSRSQVVLNGASEARIGRSLPPDRVRLETSWLRKACDIDRNTTKAQRGAGVHHVLPPAR